MDAGRWRRGWRGACCGLAFLLEPVAVAADVDHGGSVEQAVERRGGQDCVAGEDLAPVGEPEEGPAPDAVDGPRVGGAEADDQQAERGAPRLSASIARADDRPTEPSVGGRHHLLKWTPVSGPGA